MRGHDRVIVLNNPVNWKDPSGKFALQLAGIIVGAGINAYNNWGAWQSGQISDGQFWGSVGVGAATGLLSSFGVGIVSSAALGGVSAFLNSAGDQYATKPCHDINWGKASIAGGLGIAAGTIGGFGSEAGSNLIIKDGATHYVGDALQTYGNAGGIIGNATGSIVTNW